MSIIDRAKQLRFEGLTYQQIADETGLSLDKCKRELKGVKKSSDACVDELIEKSTKIGGISQYEANSIIFRHHKGIMLSKGDIKNIKNRAIYKNKDCFFRPAWIDPVSPVESYKSLMAYTDYLFDKIDEVVEMYIESYPNTNKQAVRYEIIKHVFPHINKEPLGLHIRRSEDLCERLASLALTDVDVGEEEVGEKKTFSEWDYDTQQVTESVKICEEELDEIWKPL